MKSKTIEFFRWGIYYILDCVSRGWNVLCGLFGLEQQTDLGLSWLVWLESRRVEREMRSREFKKLNKQKEAEGVMRTVKEEVDQYGQDIQNEQ
jgi:hypothetical protein